MNKRYIIGGLIAIAFLSYGIYSLNTAKIDYVNIAAAKTTDRKVQVKGVWLKENGANYDNINNKFTFTMTDESGQRVNVLYNGARPNNFEIAESIVVKGRVEGETFHATEILTKCPSKYESGPAAQ